MYVFPTETVFYTFSTAIIPEKCLHKTMMHERFWRCSWNINDIIRSYVHFLKKMRVAVPTRRVLNVLWAYRMLIPWDLISLNCLPSEWSNSFFSPIDFHYKRNALSAPETVVIWNWPCDTILLIIKTKLLDGHTKLNTSRVLWSGLWIGWTIVFA